MKDFASIEQFLFCIKIYFSTILNLDANENIIVKIVYLKLLKIILFLFQNMSFLMIKQIQ